MAVVLFAKPADPYSVRLEEFLKRKGIDFEKRSHSDLPEQKKPPQLMIDGTFVGDYEKVTSLDLQGKLEELL